jgi:hypothetical protein
MTSPSPSEPTETPRNKKRELPPSKTTGEAIERLLTLAGISVDAGWTFMDNGIPRKLDGVRELMLELLNAPSPELQRTGEAKDVVSEICKRVASSYSPDFLSNVAETAAFEACQFLSTHYEAREAQLRAEKLKVDQLEWLWANCRIIYHPDGLGAYALEHSILANKDVRWIIEMEMPAHLQPPEDDPDNADDPNYGVHPQS